VATNAKQPEAASEVPIRLWRVPVYLPCLQPSLTDAAVEDAESRLGVRLPRAYVAALRIQNGGYLRLNAHPSNHAPVDFLAGIGPRFPSLLQHDWTDVKAYMEEEGIETPAGVDELVPFCGDGHYHFCFDYREAGRQGEPRVTYVDVECFDVDECLAPDFGTFLSQLRPGEISSAYGVLARGDLSAVAAELSKATGFQFEDQGDQGNGYRVFRARLPGDAGWAWLSANQARRGFVRRSDEDYPTLSLLLPELVDRYPEHADCGSFLSCTDFGSEAGQAIVRGLMELPFPTRALRLGE
jgi:hypothetical protein